MVHGCCRGSLKTTSLDYLIKCLIIFSLATSPFVGGGQNASSDYFMVFLSDILLEVYTPKSVKYKSIYQSLIGNVHYAIPHANGKWLPL